MIDVFGIGSPLIDLLAQVPDSFLAAHGLEKDRMYLLDHATQDRLVSELRKSGAEITHAPGGSAANTMIGLAQLGVRAAFCGRLGRDEFGRIYGDKLREAGVDAALAADPAAPTGLSLVLVGADASRTMNTFLGGSQAFHYEDVPEDRLKMAKVLYVEGYLWDTDNQKRAVETAIAHAKRHGVRVALSLSDPFCVNRHRDDFRRLLERDADMVFANQEEAQALTGETISEKALEALRSLTDHVALTLGGRGALVAAPQGKWYVDPRPVAVVDTTGAGDAFAAGFLAGFVAGRPPLECGRMGVAMASEVIARMGARADNGVRARVEAHLAS